MAPRQLRNVRIVHDDGSTKCRSNRDMGIGSEFMASWISKKNKADAAQGTNKRGLRRANRQIRDCVARVSGLATAHLKQYHLSVRSEVAQGRQREEENSLAEDGRTGGEGGEAAGRS